MTAQKIVAAGISAAILLSSCGKVPEVPSVSDQKTEFLFETQRFSEFPKIATVEKIGRIVGSSAVTVPSQGIGRIEAVLVKEGDFVRKGQPMFRLSDTVANYSIRYEQSANGLESADVNYESTKISLDKAVSDAEIALSRAKIDYERTVSDAEKQLEKARRDAEKASVSSTGSDAQTTLAKAELDYANLVASNAKTIENFAPNFRMTVSDLKKLVSTVLFDSDKLIGFSDQNRDYNDAFEPYLGARDSSIMPQAQFAHSKVVAVSRFLDEKSGISVDADTVVSELSALSTQYAVVRELLDWNIRLLENSLSATTFPQSSIDGYVATYNGYKSSLSALENAFVSFKNSSTSFLSNYKNNEASALAGIELQRRGLVSGEFDAKVGFDRAKISIEAGIRNAELGLENARLNLENAQKNRETTLKKLLVNRSDAELQLKQAGVELSKLKIISPIDATIVKVIAQVGQEVSAGTAVVEISSRTPEVLIDVDSTTAAILKSGDTVEVSSVGKSFS